MPQEFDQIDVVHQEMADTSYALQSGWRPQQPSVAQQARVAGMKALVAERRQFLQAQQK